MTEKRYGSLDFLKIPVTVSIVFHHYQQMLHVKFDNFINFCDGLLYLGVLVELFFHPLGLFYAAMGEKNKRGDAGKRFCLVRSEAVQADIADDGACGGRL